MFKTIINFIGIKYTNTNKYKYINIFYFLKNWKTTKYYINYITVNIIIYKNLSTKTYSKVSGYVDTHSIFYAGIDLFIFIFFFDFIVFGIFEFFRLLLNTIL